MSQRVLEPIDRTSEVLFGVIMVLTFTGSLSVADAGRDDIRAMLIGALGCNFAWGIIDGLMYLMGTLADRARETPVVRPRLSGRDARGAVAVFLLVFLSTLPVVLPFVFESNVLRAMRLSNTIALVMLFFTGYAFGQRIRHNPWLTGLVMVVIGSVLVGLTIALGG
jgi:VIT1/CCC1 family predicted Fe2+/Mn2+ transporter